MHGSKTQSILSTSTCALQFPTSFLSIYLSISSALLTRHLWHLATFRSRNPSTAAPCITETPVTTVRATLRRYFTLTCRANGLETNWNTPLRGILLRFNPSRQQDLRISAPLGQATGFLLKECSDSSCVWCASQRIWVGLCGKLSGCKYGILLRTGR